MSCSSSSSEVRPRARTRHILHGCLLSLLLVSSLLGACSGRRQDAPQAGDSCEGFEDCARGQSLVCIGESCQKLACSRTLQCPVQTACVDGFCGAAECIVDGDCQGVGASCFEGDCREDLCEGREDCPEGQVCQGTPPTCQPPPDACSSDADCPVGEACKPETSQCVAACSQVLPCGDGSWCDEGLCRALCAEEPSRVSACDEGERCIQSLCRAPLDCSSLDPCPVNAPRRDLFSCQCLECARDEDCQIGQGEVCVEGSCLRCDGAPTQGSSCIDRGLFFASDTCCVACESDADCEAGSLCEAGECVNISDRPCDTDADCPSPLFCDGRQCVESASLTPCSGQGDCSAGEACYGDGRCHTQSTRCAAGCRAPSKCIAPVESGAQGSCVGCQQMCDANACPASQRCYVPEGEPEGWCVEQSFWGTICDE